MRSRYCKNRGFTLVEILIVVVILGILASIIVPRFTQKPPLDQVQKIDQQSEYLDAQINELNERIRFHDLESIKLNEQIDAVQKEKEALEKKKAELGSPKNPPPAAPPS